MHESSFFYSLTQLWTQLPNTYTQTIPQLYSNYTPNSFADPDGSRTDPGHIMDHLAPRGAGSVRIWFYLSVSVRICPFLSVSVRICPLCVRDSSGSVHYVSGFRPGFVRICPLCVRICRVCMYPGFWGRLHVRHLCAYVFRIRPESLLSSASCQLSFRNSSLQSGIFRFQRLGSYV